MKLKEGNQNAKMKKEKVKEANVAEIKQVFEDLQVLKLVEKQDIPKNVRALGSHLFTVEKFMETGEHGKFKSLLLSHDNEQDNLLYPERSSHTAAVHSIMTTLAVAACNGNYMLGKLDEKGTFIQTEIIGTPVNFKCRG
jgi:hypothetical protein